MSDDILYYQPDYEEWIDIHKNTNDIDALTLYINLLNDLISSISTIHMTNNSLIFRYNMFEYMISEGLTIESERSRAISADNANKFIESHILDLERRLILIKSQYNILNPDNKFGTDIDKGVDYEAILSIHSYSDLDEELLVLQDKFSPNTKSYDIWMNLLDLLYDTIFVLRESYTISLTDCFLIQPIQSETVH